MHGIMQAIHPLPSARCYNGLGRSRSTIKWQSRSLGTTSLFAAGLILVAIALLPAEAYPSTVDVRKRARIYENGFHQGSGVSQTAFNRHDTPQHAQINGFHSRYSEWPTPSKSILGVFKKAAITSDNGLCSDIGRNTMLAGGNAIDAAIASLVCIGVVNPQSSGLGGGHLMTVYNATTRRCLTINAREAAPLSANKTMFSGRPEEAVFGYRSIGVPGEIHGFWTAYTRFGSGKVSWKRLIEPSIKIAREGFAVSAHMANAMRVSEKLILDDPEMREVFVNSKTNKLYTEGEKIRFPTLADFLVLIAFAKDPAKLFYTGFVAEKIADEITSNGGHITRDDLAVYTSIVDEHPILAKHSLPGGLVMCGPKPPAGTAVVHSIVGIVSHFYGKPGPKSHTIRNDPKFYHRLIEAEKFSYAQRARLGDVAFVPRAFEVAQNLSSAEWQREAAELIGAKAQRLEDYLRTDEKVFHQEDHGTSHVSVIDSEGNAVSVTSSVNQRLGALRVSKHFGFIYNDEMDDFSTPGQVNAFGFAPSPTNFIEPQKRPQSSMSPMIVYNETSGNVRMAIGSSGGSRIISSMAQTVIRNILFDENVKEAVDAPRLHNQFFPLETGFESTTPQWLINSLARDFGQPMMPDKQPEKAGQTMTESVVQVLDYNEQKQRIYGNSDHRRKIVTYPAGF